MQLCHVKKTSLKQKDNASLDILHIFRTLCELPYEKTNNVVSQQVRHKPACTVTEAGYKLEISDLRREEIVLCRENKGADQLCSYCTLSASFVSHMQIVDFLKGQLMSFFFFFFWLAFIFLSTIHLSVMLGQSHHLLNIYQYNGELMCHFQVQYSAPVGIKPSTSLSTV